MQAQEEETYSDEDTASVITKDVYKQNPGWYLRNIDSAKIPTGILIDRVKFKNDMGLFNGKSRVKTCDYAVFRRVVKHLQKAANDSVYFPNLDSVYEFAYHKMRWEQIYPIAIMDYSYNKVRKKAFLSKLAELTDTAMTLTSGYDSIFATRRCFLASPFNIRMHGDNIQVAFYRNMFFTNSNDSVIKIEANFGNGWKTFDWDEPQSISFSAKTQYVEAKVRLTYVKNGENKQRKVISHFTVLHSGSDLVPQASDVKTSKLKSTSVEPSYKIFFPSSKVITAGYHCLMTINGLCQKWQTLYDYSNCDIEASILFAPSNKTGKLRKPIIVCDGFDPGDKRDFIQTYIEKLDEQLTYSKDTRGIYELVNGDPSPWYNSEEFPEYQSKSAGLVSTLQASNYDLVIVNFLKGAGDIRTNAYWFRRFLKEVINSGSLRDNQTEENVIIGPSMGGIITRIALDSAEILGDEPLVREWFSFDSPQEGAYIPLSLQWAIHYLDDLSNHENGSLLASLGALNSPAAKQMLLLHYQSMVAQGHTGTPNPLYNFYQLYNTLHSLKYPKLSRNIAISNGGNTNLYSDNIKEIAYLRAVGASALFGAIEWDVRIWLNNNNNVNNNSYCALFKGEVDDYNSDDDYTLYTNYQIGYENSPGGWHSALYDFNMNADNENKPDIIANTQNRWATFMPTCSAFGIVPDQYNVHRTGSDLKVTYKSQIPFDDTYSMAGANEEHVRISKSTGEKVTQYLNEWDLDTIQRPRLRPNQNNSQSISGSVKIKATNWIKLGSKNGKNNIAFNSGADVNLSATNSVKFLPGAKAVKGAKIKVKVGASVSKKSELAQVQPKPVSYPITSPFVGKVFSYDDNQEKPTEINIFKQLDKNVSIFPNPSGGTINIVVTGENVIEGMFIVTNVFGNKVMSNKVNSEKEILDLTNLANGIYFVAVSINGVSYNEKIILNK
ncbi:MAG TPA: T9SS type A sorting domain-containing protein [Bacteroidales bacterium]|nr:T9SS type A sorting domain-containing protein [Bacteroidales bacterium]